MSEALLQQWRDRVAEVEAQLDAVRDDLQSVSAQKECLAADRDRFAKREKTAKATLLAELKELEAVVMGIDEANRAAVQQRAEADKAALAAQAGYEELATTVKALQRQEKSLKTREDLGAVLESESALWDQEESAMREEIRRLEEQVSSQRTQLKARVRDAQDEAKEADDELKAARQRRSPQEGTEEVTLQMLQQLALAAAPGGASLGATDAVPRGKKGSVKRTVLGDTTNLQQE
jgi:myosin heavy subunit